MFKLAVRITLLVLLAITSALACGDKLLVSGHGVNFALIHKSSSPASILIYMNPASQLPAAEKDVQLQSVLKYAGHKPTSIANRTEFTRALTSGSYDVVLVDYSDARVLKSEIETASGSPVLLPLLYKPNKDQLAAAEKQFSCAVKADRNNRILKVLDDAMKSKQKGAPAHCQAA